MNNDSKTLFRHETRSPKVSFERERGVYAIQVTRDVAHVVVALDTERERTHESLRVLQALTQAAVPVFLIKLHSTVVTCALVGEDVSRAEQAFQAAGFQARVRRELAMVVIKAASMREVSGIMVDISDALYEAGAYLYGTGDSHDTVQCLIEAERVEPAVTGLCAVFGLSAEDVQERDLEAADAS